MSLLIHLPFRPKLTFSFRRADAKFPQALRISSLVSIQLATLQELATKHTIPAVSVSPIPSDTLPKELREKQTALGGADNEALYTMFAQSMEHRSNVRQARLSRERKLTS